MMDWDSSSWLLLLLVFLLLFVLQTWAACHIALFKRDTRSAVAWLVSVLFLPLMGTILYFWFGINRLERKAKVLRGNKPFSRITLSPIESEILPENLSTEYQELVGIAKAIGHISGFPLLGGNRIEPLDRSRAYPEMLLAIRSAKRSISLATYLFDDDPTGRQFAEALGEAVARGVEVRVLIDDVGSKYSRPTIFPTLDAFNIPNAAFLPKALPIPLAYSHLRNHRKIMVVDGEQGFTGGMNIRHNQAADTTDAFPVDDLHFRVSGPIVSQLQSTFAEDWWFTTQEVLDGENWYPSLLEPAGTSVARGIPDGPDEDLDNLLLTILTAISSAKRSVRVVTPYFLPDRDITTALNLAAMRGVEVDIVLPSKNNLRLIQWATPPFWYPLLQRGCRIWLSPPPFDHSKLMVVDGNWLMIGSANWDPRSLRLNFEFNVECYDAVLAYSLEKRIAEKIQSARRVTEEDLKSRPLWVRLRDGFARLLAPFL